MHAVLCYLVAATITTLVSAADTVPTPVAPPISFFWATSNDSNLNIPQCAQFMINIVDNPGSSVPTVPPFIFTAAPIGLPAAGIAVDVPLSSSFLWTANYPVGTQMTLAMADSANSSGGSVEGYTIVRGTNNCTLASNVTSISFTSDPPNNACSEIDFHIEGGRAPYTVSALGGGNYVNLTGLTSKKIKYGNIITAGNQFTVFISDADGASSRVSQAMDSGLGLQSCAVPSESSDGGSSLGPLVGGIVGGVLGALLLILLGYYFFRKRKAKAAEEAYRSELNPAGEYRLNDGSAPVVTPFIVPRSAADSQYTMVKHSSEPSTQISLSEQNSSGYPSYSSHEQKNFQPSSHYVSASPPASLPPGAGYSNYSNPSSPVTPPQSYSATLPSAHSGHHDPTGGNEHPSTPYYSSYHDPDAGGHDTSEPDLADPLEFEYRR